MFKGIISLFTSGLIFNPFVLSGIVLGAWCYTSMSPEEIREIFFKDEYYALVVVASIVYVLSFSRVYNRGGYSLDWGAMIMKMLANVVRFIISFALVMSFISMITIF